MSGLELFIECPSDASSDDSLPAFVIGRNFLFPCRVTDCTDAGATLQFDRAVFIGDEFRLCVDDHALDMDCRVLWRRGTTIRIRFKDR
jgi:hypothetical protein